MAEAARKAKAEESASSAATVKRASEPAHATIARAALDGRRSTLLSPKSIQPSLRVSQPSDAAEVEADRVAKAVVSMPDPTPSVSPRGGPAISRKAAPAAKPKGVPATDAKVEAEVRAAASGGTPLPMKTRKLLEPRFRANFAGVRIHTDGNAAKLANKLSARAFAFGNHIFFGGGAYDPESKAGLELLAHELTHIIQQGESIQRKADTSETRVSERTPQQASRLGLSDALDFFADAANAIPGYRMFTILIGVNPINMSAVEASAANILRAIVEFLPGGNIITRVLDSYGIFDKVGGWIEGQLKSLGISGASIKAALDKFMDSLSWKDIFNLSGVWGRAKAIFTEPIGKIISFAKSLFSEILRMVREAVLRPLAALAEGSAGYPLLKVILGFDPVTGEAVQPTADAVIGGLMTLIGQEELWANIKKANAVSRAWTWFKGAMGGLKALVTSIPGRFMAALKGLEIMDFVVLPSAFFKLAKVFGNFMGDFGSWALGTVLDLLKIIVEVVAPGVMPYIAKAGAAFNKILKNPVGFVQTLVRAAMQGFRQFASNFLTHLKASLVGWLTGALGGAGVYIPQGFSLREILKFVLSVLGLTWANIRGKLVKATSETAVKALEMGFDLVKTLITEGPAAAWQKILESLTNLKDMVIQQVMDFVKSKVVEAAVTKLLSMLSPAGALIQAIIAIYNTVMFFVERLKQIAAVAASFIDSLATIAAGNVGPAANRVEQTMAGLLTLVISFLARIAGLGKVSDAVVKLIAKVRAPIDKGLDKAVAWIVEQARKIGKFVAQAGVPQDPNERLKLAGAAAVAVAKPLTGRVSPAILSGLFGAIRVRYALTTLEPFEEKGRWKARVSINPFLVQDLNKPVVILGPDGKPASQSTPSAGGGAREPEGPNMAPLLEKMKQVFAMFEMWARLGTAPVAQAMMRQVRMAMDQAQSLSEDQKRGTPGSVLAPRFTALSGSLRAIQALDPKYELVSIGQMSITLNAAKRQMPAVTITYVIPPKFPPTHPSYAALMTESTRQLREQEAGVNSMVAAEWLARRPAVGMALVRPPAEAAMRKEYGARSNLAGTGMAAPHNPDQVLAGYIDPTGAPALGVVNSFIGNQNRLKAQQVQGIVTAMSPTERLVTQLNFKLVI